MAGPETLSPDEEKLLFDANEIYLEKDFEYLSVRVIYDMGTAYSRYPDLNMLEVLTDKLIKNLCVVV